MSPELYKMDFTVPPFNTVGTVLSEKEGREMGLGVLRWHGGFRVRNAGIVGVL